MTELVDRGPDWMIGVVLFGWMDSAHTTEWLINVCPNEWFNVYIWMVGFFLSELLNCLTGWMIRQSELLDYLYI